MNYKKGYANESTCLQGKAFASFSELVEILGKPSNSGDGYKTTTQWALVSEDGRQVFVYDWKATSLFDATLPSPSEMRLASECEWSVGAGDPVAAGEFFAWFGPMLWKLRENRK